MMFLTSNKYYRNVASKSNFIKKPNNVDIHENEVFLYTTLWKNINYDQRNLCFKNIEKTYAW